MDILFEGGIPIFVDVDPALAEELPGALHNSHPGAELVKEVAQLGTDAAAPEA